MEIQPGEWRATTFGVYCGEVEIADCVLGSKRQPNMTIPEAQANAERIVKAVNSYDAMKDGLKDALREICRMCVRLNPQHENCTSCAEMERSRRPLLEAEGNKTEGEQNDDQ